MDIHGNKTIQEVISMTDAQMGYSPLRSIISAMHRVLFFHVSFAVLLIFNDYVFDSWKVSVLPHLPQGWDRGLYYIGPLILFIFGLVKLQPLYAFVQTQMKEGNNRVLFHPKILNDLQMVNMLSILLVIFVGAMVITFEDHFASHVVILFFWAIFILKTRAAIGPWA